MPATTDNVRDLYDRLAAALLSRRSDAGVWPGELSSSALSTAVACFALRCVDAEGHSEAIRGGLGWLALHGNADGGYGDTIRSESNLSTSLLAWSALAAAGGEWQAATERVEQWLRGRIGEPTPAAVAAAVLAHYGEDRTFSVPILTLCALAGRLGPEPECWESLPQLPFELSLCPHGWYSFLGLPVVSYALPALIAMGIVRYRRASRKGVLGPVRAVCEAPALKRLAGLQPANGGFLEATPLTGFVLMSLACAGHGGGRVARKAADFLVQSRRPDGSWPIDTNLETWLTTLSVNALGADLPPETFAPVRTYLLESRFRTRHPYTGAAPGGWGWTALPGSVPDADDTAGAVLALRRTGPPDADARTAAFEAIDWLLNLRNRDGGVPTFCRGWGKLPFDRSCPDITAHAMAAMAEWLPEADGRRRRRMSTALAEGAAYLRAVQGADGSWMPLWFGNEKAPGAGNPVYGTSRVLPGLEAALAAGIPNLGDMIDRGRAFLRGAANADGGWGGAVGVPSGPEETGLALAALAFDPAAGDLIRRGVSRLERFFAGAAFPEACPIGLYFASLWYYEELYPAIFALWGLRRCLDASERPEFGTGGT